MGADNFLTAKAIGNRIKAKGLNRLRWYCQVCQKSCRDENGFKNHIASEAHHKKILTTNMTDAVSSYSKTFLSEFLQILERRHGTKRVLTNRVYQEYIAERHHVHLNATRWSGLGDLSRWLGREGIAVVDEDEKGWWLTWIDNSSETLAKREAITKLEKLKQTSEERDRSDLESQIRKAKQHQPTQREEPKDLERDVDERISMKLVTPKVPMEEEKTRKRVLLDDEDEEEEDQIPKKKEVKMEKPQMKQPEVNRYPPKEEEIDRPWICTGIYVKVMNKSLNNGAYYKCKGQIKAVDDYIAEVVLSDTSKRIRVDQDELETVLPSIGGSVRILRGSLRGTTGKLISINTEHYSANVRTSKGERSYEYEDISKCDA